MVLSISLVLSLSVGAYTFGLFGPSVDKVLVTTARVTEGLTSDNNTNSATANVLIILKNPGDSTNISIIQMNQNGWTSSITAWSITPGNQVGNSFYVGGHNFLPGGNVSLFSLYPVTSPPETIKVGQTYSYMISFSNGQSISGYFIAQ